MPRRHVVPGRLRRRLTVAFVLVAGLSAGVLAAGSFLLVRTSRLDDSRDRARAEAVIDIRAAQQFPRAPVFDVQGLLAGFENTGAHAVLLIGGRQIPSSARVNPPIPRSLRAIAARGELAFERVRAAPAPGVPPEPLLLVGGPIGDGDQLFLVISERGLQRDLDQLRTVLLLGWILILAIAAMVGNVLARRTLEPVDQASQAARDMAEGLLDTRLPEEGGDEFGVWAASFNRMADALESKITALSEAEARERRFTSDVSHELRTPVAALVGEASVLREFLGAMPADARRISELLVRDIARLRRLVEDLMEISRFDAGRESVVLEPVDVDGLLSQVVRSRGWVGSVRFEGRAGTVASDRRRLERIASNLIGNALEHGGPPVTVRLADADELRIEVADRGPGIPEEHLEHLFERFYKADPSRAGTGSGLGLAIAMENARLLHGTITVASGPGAGTVFTVRLRHPELPVSERLRRGEGVVSDPPDDRTVRSTEGGEP